MNDELEKKIREAEDAVRRCIEDHEAGRNAPFSVKFLTKIQGELRLMAVNSEYKPAYPRFLLDWPDGTGLKTMLMDLEYQFIRVKRK